MGYLYYIYKITNLNNGKTYIGQHKYKEGLYPDDYQALITDGYWGSGVVISEARKKYGKANFSKDILVSHLEFKEAADEAEKYFISCFRAMGKAEYNIADGGEGGATHGYLGTKHTEEAKRKISEATIGSKNGMYGRHHSEEAKRKIALNALGNKWCLGHHLSEETKRKIGQANSGKKRTEEVCRKMSEARSGSHHTEETRKKMSEALKGHHLSEEAKRKISEKAVGRYKGTHWFNNGEVSIRALTCPEGFKPGKITGGK